MELGEGHSLSGANVIRVLVSGGMVLARLPGGQRGGKVLNETVAVTVRRDRPVARVMFPRPREFSPWALIHGYPA